MLVGKTLDLEEGKLLGAVFINLESMLNSVRGQA